MWQHTSQANFNMHDWYQFTGTPWLTSMRGVPPYTSTTAIMVHKRHFYNQVMNQPTFE